MSSAQAEIWRSWVALLRIPVRVARPRSKPVLAAMPKQICIHKISRDNNRKLGILSLLFARKGLAKRYDPRSRQSSRRQTPAKGFEHGVGPILYAGAQERPWRPSQARIYRSRR
jgi:hypothetical protein